MATLSIEIAIASSKERVWDILADYGNISDWSPSIPESGTTSSIAQGVGAVRSCEVDGLGHIEETVLDWKDGDYMTFELAPVGPMKKSISTWTVRESGDKIIVRATVQFQAKFGLIGVMMEKMIMRRKFVKVLSETLQGLRHYCETGEKIGTGLPVNIEGDPPVEVAA